jgi:putative endonuclease
MQESSQNFMKYYYVYILASKRNGTLYIGVTNDLVRRISEHRGWAQEWFTKKYNVHMLVWYELFGDIEEAIALEKRMKKWKRDYKINIIEERNPIWKDLFDEIIQ